MTEPINERLAKILAKLSLSSHSSRYLDGENENEAKVAILSIFREMVEEAKPAEQETSLQLWKESLNETHAMMLVDYGTGYNKALNQYHANLLQQLGDKK